MHGVDVESSGSATTEQGADSPRGEHQASPSSTPMATTARAEDVDAHVTQRQQSSRPTAAGSGLPLSRRASAPQGDGLPLMPAVVPVSADARRRGIRVTAGAAVTAFFLGLYVMTSDDLFLVAASTALALVLTWLAEPQLGRGGVH